MDPNGVKEALLGLEDCGADFSVVFSGKASKKVNGLYKPYSREIVLHNRNFENDNQLMYTAVHEYAHHIQYTAAGGELSPRHHTAEFWACFHGLLKKAEEAGLRMVPYKSFCFPGHPAWEAEQNTLIFYYHWIPLEQIPQAVNQLAGKWLEGKSLPARPASQGGKTP